MKSIRLFLVVFALTVSFSGVAQKVKLKKGEVLIDDVTWLKYTDCGGMDPTCSLLSSGGDELVFMKWIGIDGVEPYSKANPHGTLRYVEIVFLGMDAKIEIQKSQKDIIAMIYNSKVVTPEGKLDADKVARFVEKYGTPFSDRLNRTSKETIIIKEEPRKSGININIGN